MNPDSKLRFNSYRNRARAEDFDFSRRVNDHSDLRLCYPLCPHYPNDMAAKRSEVSDSPCKVRLFFFGGLTQTLQRLFPKPYRGLQYELP